MTACPRGLVALAALATAGAAGAQSNLHGRVLRADSTPMANARITASVVRTTTRHAATSDSDGRFRFDLAPADWTIDIRAIGFKPWTETVRIRSRDSVKLVAILSILPPTLLDSVVARAAFSNLEGFEQRRARGPGTFFTREDIRRMQPRVLTDVLRRAPGIYLRAVPTSFGEHITPMSSRTRPCPVAFVLNGSPLLLPNDMAVDTYIPSTDVIAIEVYAGSSQVPAQFNSSAATARCGLIAVWTRNGRSP
jgi:hypothetical protein